MRLPNAGSQAEPESEKSGAQPVQEHEAEHFFSLCAPSAIRMPNFPSCAQGQPCRKELPNKPTRLGQR